MRISDWALYAFMVLLFASAMVQSAITLHLAVGLLDLNLYLKALAMFVSLLLVYQSPGIYRQLVSSIRRRRSYEIGLFPTRSVWLHYAFIREREFFRWFVVILGVVHLLNIIVYFLSAGAPS